MSCTMCSFGVELDVGLRDGVAIFFPRGEIEAEGLEVHGALACGLEGFVLLLRVGDFEVVTLTETALTGVGYGNVVEHDAVLDATVGRLDEAVFVDAGEAAEREMRPMFGPSGVSIGQMRP